MSLKATCCGNEYLVVINKHEKCLTFEKKSEVICYLY